MLTFYKTDCITITNESETLTNEQSISVSNDSSVLLSFYVPSVVAGIRIYRSTITNEEKLLVDIPLPDEVRKKPIVSFPFSFVDTGDLSTNLVEYPLVTDLTLTEQLAIPDPVFTLEEGTGSLSSDTYFYRVSFYTVTDLAPVYTEKDVYIKFFTPDLTEVMIYSRDDLTSETAYTEILNPYAYIDLISDDLIYSGITLGIESFYAQQLNVGGSLVKKNVYSQIPVSISLTSTAYLVNKPVIMSLIPNDIEIEVVENALIGPSQTFIGTVSKTFPDPGSVVYFPSERSRHLISVSGGSFKVIT